MILNYNNNFQYKVLYTRRRTLGLSISPIHGAIVRAPMRTSQARILELLTTKELWIIKHLDDIESKKQNGDYDRKVLTLEQKILAKQKLENYMENQLPFWAQRIGVNYYKVSIKDTKSRWGSCSATGNLGFALRLSFCPQGIIDYVIVHELCHRLEMNHSQKFWLHVAYYYPQFQTARKWLKVNGNKV